MIYRINSVNICMSGILACVECLLCHCIELMREVIQVGKFHYWALLTLSREYIFLVPKTHVGIGCIWDLRSEEMAKLALSCFSFCKILGKGPLFV